jgi:predicted dehydrogenase
MTPLRIGIVGCGEIADYLHAPAIKASAACRLQAVVDPAAARAENLQKKYNINSTGRSISEIASEVDAVVIATPPHLRAQLVNEAMRLGLAVLCEKPLANTVAECLEICRIAGDQGRTLGVCHQFRFWPNRRRIQQMLETRELPLPDQIIVSQGSLYSWKTVSGYTVRKDMVSGGVMINAGTHPMDTLISWCGSPSSFHYTDDSFGGLESNAKMSVVFENGVRCEFRISRTCRLENEIRLVWKDLSISMTNSDPFHYVVHRGYHLETVICGSSQHGFLQPAIDLYENFASSVRSGTLPTVDGVEGTRVIRWVEECYQQKKSRALPAIAPTPGIAW